MEKEEGIPVWNKAQSRSLAQHNLPGDTLVLVPLVRDGEKQTSGFMVCKVGQNEVTIVQLVRNRYYAAYGFNNNSKSATASDVALQSLIFDQQIFGDSSFAITDNRLFNNNLSKRTNGKNGSAIITLMPAVPAASSHSAKLMPVPTVACYTVTYKGDEGNLVGAAPGEDPNYYYTTEVCTPDIKFIPDGTPSFPVGGGPALPGGASVAGWPGGGSGGAASPKPATWYNGCEEGKLMFLSDGIKKTDCVEFTEKPAWKASDLTLTLIPEQQRLNQLLDFLKDNPEALLPCSELSKLKIYGQMYQSVAQFGPSSYIISNLDLWSTVYNITLEPTYLEYASGTTVNADFFPIRIDKMPTIFAAEGTTSPQQLLEYFRNNINSFIDNDIATFTPYKEKEFDAIDRWREVGENAVSSVLHLNMDVDGDVVLSDYTANAESASMTVSTIKSSLSGYHPVQGNRRWGMYTATEGYKVFYTMGVDRISITPFSIGNALMDALATSGFEDADNLWRSLQTNMVNFINEHGGKASVAQEIVVRTPYDSIKDYLNGTITLDQLKANLDCP